MESFWYYYFEASYNKDNGSMTTAKGNGVARFNSKSFLPGSLVKIIERSVRENLHIPTGRSVSVFIQSFGEIDIAGYNDYNTPADEGAPVRFGFTTFQSSPSVISINTTVS